MEILAKSQERKKSLLLDTSSTRSNSNSNRNSSSSNGILLATKATLLSETSLYPPTTFIQADPNSFKQVVQMLTGSSEITKQASKPADPPSKSTVPPPRTGPKKPSFKLYERRNSLKNLKISPFRLPCQPNCSNAFSPRQPEILSPSTLDFPSLVLSPVTPLIPDPFNKPPPFAGEASVGVSAEEKAIAEKGFYLHPSPITTPRESEPRLLPLFPETSLRLSGSSSSS